MIHVTRLAQVCIVDGNTRIVMGRWKGTVEVRDGWRKDAEGIRNVDSHLESAYYFITHFS